MRRAAASTTTNHDTRVSYVRFFRPMGDKREIHGTWLNVSLRCTNCSVSRKGGKKYIAVLGSLGRLNLEFHLSSRKDKITKIQSSLQNLLLFRALS